MASGCDFLLSDEESGQGPGSPADSDGVVVVASPGRDGGGAHLEDIVVIEKNNNEVRL